MRFAATALILCTLVGCGRRGVSRHWEDGNYMVYSRPVSEEIIMGHYMGDGAVLGLSGPTVVSASSDSRYVVFRRETAAGGIEHYYIEKKPDGAGDASGPYAPDAYEPIAKKLNLPAFSWHLPETIQRHRSPEKPHHPFLHEATALPVSASRGHCRCPWKV